MQASIRKCKQVLELRTDASKSKKCKQNARNRKIVQPPVHQVASEQLAYLQVLLSGKQCGVWGVR